MQLALQPEEGGRNWSCQLMRLMWSTRRRVSIGWLIRGADILNDAGLCTPSWTLKMADVSTVLEKGTPSVSVLLGKEVSYVNQKGGVSRRRRCGRTGKRWRWIGWGGNCRVNHSGKWRNDSRSEPSPEKHYWTHAEDHWKENGMWTVRSENCKGYSKKFY